LHTFWRKLAAAEGPRIREKKRVEKTPLITSYLEGIDQQSNFEN